MGLLESSKYFAQVLLFIIGDNRYTHGKLTPYEKVDDKWLVANPMIKQHQEFTLTPITAAVCDEELTYFATGHKDGCVFVWSNRTGFNCFDLS